MMSDQSPSNTNASPTTQPINNCNDEATEAAVKEDDSSAAVADHNSPSQKSMNGTALPG